MSIKDEASDYYKVSHNVNIILSSIFWINIILSLSLIIFNTYTLQIKIINILLIVMSFTYPLISVIDDNFLWYNAERLGRQNCVKDAFKININNINVDGYYNNNLEPSFERYVMNTWENIFFSKNIAGKMLAFSVIKSFICFIVFIITCRISINNNVIVIIAQTTFSAKYILGTLSLAVYKYRLDKLYETFLTIFLSDKSINTKERIIFLGNIIEYESIKAHYKIRLSTKIYNQLNPKLSTEWNSISNKYKFE